MGCTMRRRVRLWRCAARRSGNRRWWSRWDWTSRRCVPSVGRPIPSDVPPVASYSCARMSSHGEGLLPAWHQRSTPHEIRTAGEPCQGRRVPGGGQGTGATAYRQYAGAADAPSTAIAPARVGSAEPVTGRMTEGGPQVNSIARGCQNLVRPHRYAVSPTKCYPKCSGPGGSPPRSSLP
jgi:hypothetical protein